MIKMAINRTIDAYTDFDNTLVKSTINGVLKINTPNRKGFNKFLGYIKLLPYGLREYLGINYNKNFENFINFIFKDVTISDLEENIKNIGLKNLSIIEEKLGKDEKNIIILSKNDYYVINYVLESCGLKKELFDKYKIKIIDIISNIFEKKEGVYTGNISDYRVKSKMVYLKNNNLPFFCDWLDFSRYKKDHKELILVN